MKKYISPFTEIIPVITAENLLLKGSDRITPIAPSDDDIVVGEDRANSTSKSLWDEE